MRAIFLAWVAIAPPLVLGVAATVVGQAPPLDAAGVNKQQIETALKLGIAPRAEISHPDEAKRYLDMGVKHFCIGTDVSILFQWFVHNGKSMRTLLGREESAPGEAEGKSSYGTGAARDDR